MGFGALALALLLLTVRTYSRIHPFLTVIAAGGVIASGALAVAWATTTTPVVEKHYPEPNIATHLRIDQHAYRIQKHREQTGELPDALIYREPSGWWEPNVVGTIEDANLDAWGRKFRYERFDEPDANGHRFDVISAGADGAFGTTDDIDRSLTWDDVSLMDHAEHQAAEAE